MPPITTINNDATALGPKTSSSNHTAWLEQLESAQWQQRLRYQPHAAQRQPQASALAQDTAQQSAHRRSVFSDVGQLAEKEQQAGAPSGGGVQNTRLQTQRAALTLPAAETRFVFGPGLSEQQRTPVGSAARESQAWLPPRRLAALNWQPQNAHIMASSDGLRVWLRDAGYEKGDGLRLLLELRARFARLGYRLAEFTLNGEQVAQASQTDQPD